MHCLSFTLGALAFATIGATALPQGNANSQVAPPSYDVQPINGTNVTNGDDGSSSGDTWDDNGTDDNDTGIDSNDEQGNNTTSGTDTDSNNNNFDDSTTTDEDADFDDEDSNSNFTLPTPPYCPPQDVDPWTQEAIFAAFVQKFLVDNNATGAITDHLSNDYIQHNPFVNSGRKAVLDFFRSPTSPADNTSSSANTNTTILNQAFSDDVGFVQYKTETPGQPPSVTVDIYRFNGSCIMEHWDVSQERPANATNPLAMF